jgi:hypothetical protein
VDGKLSRENIGLRRRLVDSLWKMGKLWLSSGQRVAKLEGDVIEIGRRHQYRLLSKETAVIVPLPSPVLSRPCTVAVEGSRRPPALFVDTSHAPKSCCFVMTRSFYSFSLLLALLCRQAFRRHSCNKVQHEWCKEIGSLHPDRNSRRSIRLDLHFVSHLLFRSKT